MMNYRCATEFQNKVVVEAQIIQEAKNKNVQTFRVPNVKILKFKTGCFLCDCVSFLKPKSVSLNTS